MTEHLDAAADQLVATRIVRFEQSGVSPADGLEQLAAASPTLPGMNVTWRRTATADSQALEAQSGQVRLTARAFHAHIELIAASASDSADRTQLAQIIDVLTDAVADPERARTHTLLTPADTGSEAATELDAQRLFERAELSLSRDAALRLVVQSIDLTTLAGDDTPGRVRALCSRAVQPDPTDPTVGPCAAICVYPNLVSTAADVLDGSDVGVASVAGAFPSGLSSLEVRLSDIAEAVCAGADEIDVVLNRSAFLAGNDELVLSELSAMRAQIGPRVMKVILETSELQTPAAIRRAADLAMQAGADWIKTSTGKSSMGATPVAVFAMAQAIADYGAPIGLKISGGVRTSADALGYLAILESTLGPDVLTPDRVRFGASGLLGAVVTDLMT